jgi:hypothetical protein
MPLSPACLVWRRECLRTYNDSMPEDVKPDPRNPSEVQVDILLEAQRGLAQRITALENELDTTREDFRRREAACRDTLKDIYCELDTLNAVTLRQPVPRRCSYCFGVVGDDLSSCPSCLRVL